MSGWYNGFSPTERARSPGRVAREKAGEVLPAASKGSCQLCGDPNAWVEPHLEDYTTPYRYDAPYCYWLCINCHRNKLHKRFAKPDLWAAFLAHVRRGGYASDLKKPEIKKEFDAYRKAMSAGGRGTLRQLRNGRKFRAVEWWDRLTMDPACIEPGYPKPNFSSFAERITDWDSDTVSFSKPDQ